MTSRTAQVICALNDGFADDDVLGPTSARVASTVAAYNALFGGLYPINAMDDARGVPGILYGRYQGDVYAGARLLHAPITAAHMRA